MLLNTLNYQSLIYRQIIKPIDFRTPSAYAFATSPRNVKETGKGLSSHLRIYTTKRFIAVPTKHRYASEQMTFHQRTLIANDLHNSQLHNLKPVSALCAQKWDHLSKQCFKNTNRTTVVLYAIPRYIHFLVSESSMIDPQLWKQKKDLHQLATGLYQRHIPSNANYIS